VQRPVDILGYGIEAPDGPVGYAVDFCIEDESWVVTGLLADPRGALRTSRRIFVPLSAIERVDRREKKIYVTSARDQLARGSRREPRPRKRPAGR
jgi:hypothetical protein